MIDNLIERLPCSLYFLVRRFEYWLLAPKNVCLYCIDCEEYCDPGPEGDGWWCDFREVETDWQNTCRAFKKGKRIDQRKEEGHAPD